MRKSFYRYLTKLFKADPRVVILLGDIGVFSFKEAFEYDPKRIYNLGILEQSMIGVAAGLADCGYIPFVHSIAPFVTERCIEQIKIDLAYESKNVFVVSVGNSYDYSKLGITHHCPNDLHLLNAIPNLDVHCPGNEHEVEFIIQRGLERKNPKYIRLSEYSNDVGGLIAWSPTVIQHGVDPKGTIVVVGNAIKNLHQLFDAKLPAQIIYVYDITSFNTGMFIDKPGKIITVVEPGYDCGILSNIATSVKNIGAMHSISVSKQFIDHYGQKKELDDYLHLSDEHILNRLREIYE